MGILSPRGEEKVTFIACGGYFEGGNIFCMLMSFAVSNIPLAPWGEDAHRAGEGHLIIIRNYDRQMERAWLY